MHSQCFIAFPPRAAEEEFGQEEATEREVGALLEVREGCGEEEAGVGVGGVGAEEDGEEAGPEDANCAAAVVRFWDEADEGLWCCGVGPVCGR